jgi:hypothetical protein
LGASTQYSWLIHAGLKANNRTDKITVTFTDDRGATMVCAKVLPVQGVDALLACSLLGTTHLLSFDASSGQYQPAKWTISDTLTNAGNISLNNLEAAVQWTNPGGMQFVELDPGYPGNTNPRTVSSLGSGQQAQFTWGFRSKTKNTSPDIQRVVFSVTYQSDEYSDIPAGCSEYVDVGLSDVTPAESVSPPLEFRLYQNHPNPFKANTTISYDLPAASYVRVTIHDLLGREILKLVSARQDAGHYIVPFDVRGLPSGMYLYRLSAGNKVQTMKMIVER